MGIRDVLVWRGLLQWRAVRCARAGLMIQAAVWAMAADMCQAAAWTAQHGPLEAERLVQSNCQGD